jgi:peptide/nickel transport system substrate-binding protein
MTRRPFRRAAAAALLGTAIALTGAAWQEAEADTLRFVPHADLRLYDPVYSTNVITVIHGYLIWDTLFGLDEDNNVQPQMVDTWEVSEDGLTYGFTLRDGLIWHDGEPVLASDAVASLERWGKRDGMGRRLMERVEAIEAKDDKSFEIRLSRPYGLVLQSLAKSSQQVPFIMPAHLAATDPFEQFDAEEMIGSGPFRFVHDEWAPGSRVVYERFDGYVPRDEPASFTAGGKVANFERVEWVYMPDPATGMAALQAGEVDFYENPPIDLVSILEADPNVVVEVLDTIGIVTALRPNFLHPPFDDVRARQALLWLTDLEPNLQAGVGDPRYFTPCAAIFMCDTPHETDVGAEALLAYDLDKARELLEEAGYDGQPIVILDPTDIPYSHAFALILADTLRQLDMPVEVRSSDWATVTTRRTIKDPPAEGGWHIFFSGWPGNDMSSPITNYPLDSSGETAWWGWPQDEEIESLRSEYVDAVTDEERDKIIDALQRRAYEYVPYVPIGQFFDPVAYRAELVDVIPSWAPLFWNMRREGG